MTLTMHHVVLTTTEPDMVTPLDGTWVLRVLTLGGKLLDLDTGTVAVGTRTQGTEAGVTTFTLPAIPQDDIDPADATYQLTFTPFGGGGSVTSAAFQLDGDKTLADLTSDSGLPITPSLVQEAKDARDEAVAAAATVAGMAPLVHPNFTGPVLIDGVPVNTGGSPDLFAHKNGDFETAVPLNDTTTVTNWRTIDGTIRSIQSVTDGPLGVTTNVLRITTAGNYGIHIFDGLIASEYAGQTMRLKFDGRAIASGSATTARARIIVTDDDTSVVLIDSVISGFALVNWVRDAHLDIAIPSTTNRIKVQVGTSSTAGTGRMEFDNFRLNLASATLAEATTMAINDAVAAGQLLTPTGASAKYVPNAAQANYFANGYFTSSVPLNDSSTLVNWRSVDGTIRSITTTTDDDGNTINALKTTNSTTASHVGSGFIADGLAGTTARLALHVQAEVVGAVENAGGRVIITDRTHANTVLETLQIENIPSTRRVLWEHDFTVPSGCDSISVAVSSGTHPGSGHIIWSEVSLGVAQDSAKTLRKRAITQAVAVADATYVRSTERPDGFFASQFMSFSKGGVVGTSGKPALALRFDDWWDQFLALNIIGELSSRGLFGSCVWISRLAQQSWNATATYADLRTWVQQYGMEVWSHGIDHKSPYQLTTGAPDPTTYTENLVRQIITSKAEIEAQNLRVMGYAHPGVSAPGYDSDSLAPLGPAFLTETQTGRLVTSTYPLAEFDMSGAWRNLPSDLRYGLGHTTVSDGMTLAAAKAFIDNLILRGTSYGLECMTHTGNLAASGGPGVGMTVTEWLQWLDYIVVKRDAGLIEVVTPSSLPFVDPSSTKRLDLIWPAAMSSSGGTVTHDQCIGHGIAGMTWEFRATLSTASTGVGSFTITSKDIAGATHAWTISYTPTASGTPTTVRKAFSVPLDVGSITITLGASSGSVVWANPHVYVA